MLYFSTLCTRVNISHSLYSTFNRGRPWNSEKLLFFSMVWHCYNTLGSVFSSLQVKEGTLRYSSGYIHECSTLHLSGRFSDMFGVDENGGADVCKFDTNTSNFSMDASCEVRNNESTEAISIHEQIDIETIFDWPKRSIRPPNEVQEIATEPYHEFGLVEETPMDFSDEWLYLAIQQLWPVDHSGLDDNSRFTNDESCYDQYSFPTNTQDSFLPEWSVVSTRETLKMPPITLVLDLDETLVHSTLDTCDDADFSFPVHYSQEDHTVYVRKRPHLRMFLESVACMFEIIVFTAGQSSYAERLLDILDPDHTLIGQRIYRDSCVFSEGGYIKDLTILGRDLARIAIVDNSPQVFQLQVENGIPIESWFGDPSDNALVSLLSFLETLVGADDVRPIIRKKYGSID